MQQQWKEEQRKLKMNKIGTEVDWMLRKELH